MFIKLVYDFALLAEKNKTTTTREFTLVSRFKHKNTSHTHTHRRTTSTWCVQSLAIGTSSGTWTSVMWSKSWPGISVPDNSPLPINHFYRDLSQNPSSHGCEGGGDWREKLEHYLQTLLDLTTSKMSSNHRPGWLESLFIEQRVAVNVCQFKTNHSLV